MGEMTAISAPRSETRAAALPPRLFLVLYAARFSLAHRALCAAAIRLRPAIEIVRFGFGA